MKKILNIKFLSVILLSAFLASCDNKDDATGYSNLEVATDVVGTITFNGTLAASQTVNEIDENAYQYTITLNKPQPVDIHVKVIQIGGTANAEDYKIDNEVIIPAYTTSATGSIKIVSDCTIESAETLVLQIGTITTANASIPSKTVSFTINNNASTDLELALNFNKSFTISGVPRTLTATVANGGFGFDMDFYVLDSSYNDTGIADAQTGASPEKLTLKDANLPDGTYHIFFDIYDDGGLSTTFHDPFSIPISVDYSKCGSIDPGTFNQESTYAPLSTDGSGNGYVMTIVKTSGVYTLKNSLSEVIASGRNSNKIKDVIRNARLRKNKTIK